VLANRRTLHGSAPPSVTTRHARAAGGLTICHGFAEGWRQRCPLAGALVPVHDMLLETGMGIDLHGANSTKAARRAVEDAIGRVSLLFLRVLTRGRQARVSIEVTVGVPDPDTVDKAAVAAALPVGRADVRCERGGLEMEAGGERIVLAVAAVVVRMELEDS
jgi:uncharacterized protein (TIGR02058 family)